MSASDLDPSAVQRKSAQRGRAGVPFLQDSIPIDIRTNTTPASIDVMSNLAEDTIVGGVMDIAKGTNKVAMFANPFADGAEEMLYIDENAKLRWARHVNPASAAAGPAELNGWSIDKLDSSALGAALEVVVAVHPRGSLWAFVLFEEIPGTNRVYAFELVADGSVLGGLLWKDMGLLLDTGVRNLQGLSLQYCSDRPATPFVFVTDPGEPRLFWFCPTYPTGSDVPWHKSGELKYDSADRNVPTMACVDGPETPVPFGMVVEAVRLWSVVDNFLYLTSYFPTNPNTPFFRQMIGTLPGYSKLLGTWNAPQGGGVVVTPVAAPGNPPSLGLASPHVGVDWVILDRPLDDVVVWSDADNMVHLYGRGADATLNVVHQLGWQSDSELPPGWTKPLWDQHLKDGSWVTTTRPLVGQVATFAVDAFPDDLPSQHVMHQGVVAGESCAIYTQSVRTNFWYTEQVRLIPKTVAAPYTVPRYQTCLTVKDGYGSPMAGVQVSLTADVPVDLEVDGRFYRTGSITPVTLTTDTRGRATLRVVASGLSAPQMYATTPGLSQAVTIQMAAGVHKFLAGNATLPNHTLGFTAATVEAATKADGKPLFPNIRKTGTAGDWPPSAADVVAWCQGAFAVESGAPLPAEMFTGLGMGEQVLAFTLQTHDPKRSGFQVYSSAEQLTAREQALADKGVLLGDVEDWVGDVWQGIRQDVAAIGEVYVGVASRTIELVITFADGVIQRLKAAWDDIVSAAHAVEAVFVAIGAKISDALEWLKWAFDFKDALIAAKALRTLVDSAPKMIKATLTDIGTVTDGFFLQKKAEVKTYFSTIKAELQGRSFGSLQGATATVPSEYQPSATTTTAGDQVQSPHANWLIDKAMGSSALDAGTPTKPFEDDEIVKLINGFVGDMRASSAFNSLSAALLDLKSLFTNLFSGKDAASILASEIITILDFAENLVLFILEFLDSVANSVITWCTSAIDQVLGILNTKLDDSPLVKMLWDFVLSQTDLNPDEYPLTLGLFGAFFAAYPFCLVYKSATGKAPFVSGDVIPVPTAAGGVGQFGTAPPHPLLFVFQAFQGAVQANDFFLDTWLNLSAAGKTGSVGSFALKFFAVMHTIGYTVGDHPWFWGYPPFKESKLPYFRYTLTCCFNIVDLFLAFKYGRIVEMFEPEEDDPDKVWKEEVYMLVTTAMGLIRIGINVAEYQQIPYRNEGKPATWFDTWNLWVNITAYIQTATGFVRFLYMRFPNQATGSALLIKGIIDGASDLFSGICTIIQPVQASLKPARVDTTTNRDFTGLQLWQPFMSPDIKAIDGYPGYNWATTTDDFQNPLPWDLPQGLELDTPDYASTLGAVVRIVGTPATTFPKTYFKLWVADSYGPSTGNFVSCAIEVSGPPAGIPDADFTFTPPTGLAPLTVQFDDTSTGAPAKWHWTLDDGKPDSANQNPSAQYTVADTYTVTLVAINDKGYSAPTTKQITVAAPEGTPIADFKYTQTLKADTLTVFTDISSGNPTNWQWDFGNGQTSTQRNPEIIWEAGGDFVVSLIAYNDKGWGVRMRRTVTVSWWA